MSGRNVNGFANLEVYMELTLKIIDKNGRIKSENTDENQVTLVSCAEYEPGDRICLESSEKNMHIVLQVDDALGVAFVYITGDVVYNVPFEEKKISYSPKAFSGGRHYLYARAARENEVTAYRNLALNAADQPGDTNCYPHATANVETRGESVFAARNAIDGVTANTSHGEWPYESWGIGMRDDAAIKVEFGRMVEADKVVLYTRSDFPHDNWWRQVTVTFSDGSSVEWKLEKSRLPHILNFDRKKINWVQLSSLIKSDEPSPFPALSQIEVYGTVCI